MTTIPRPNRKALDDALDTYRDAMRPFLLRALRRVKGANLQTTIQYALPPQQRDMFDRSLAERNNDVAGAIDIGMFPHLVNANWRAVFSDEFRRDETARDLIWIITKARNTAAHPGATDMDFGYTYSRLTDIADVLRRINALDAKKEVEAIRDRINIQSIREYSESQRAQEVHTDSDNDEPMSSQPRAEPKLDAKKEVEVIRDKVSLQSNDFWDLRRDHKTIPNPDNDELTSFPPRTESKQAAKPPQKKLTDATEQFVIKEDDPTNSARIHRADCRHYVNRKKETLPDSRWHSRFYALEDAESAMSDLGKRDSRRCGHCMR